MFSFFFFQAEDGIRDSSVNGVQTCALPISGRTKVALLLFKLKDPVERLWYAQETTSLKTESFKPEFRSEERRVGKECRARRSTKHEKKKDKTAQYTRTMIADASHREQREMT